MSINLIKSPLYAKRNHESTIKFKALNDHAIFSNFSKNGSQ